MYPNDQTVNVSQARQQASTVFLAKVFNWMAIGLGLTGVVAYVTAHTGLTEAIITSPLFMILIFAQLGFVFFLSARINKIQASTATALFIGYSLMSGLTLSTIFLAYTESSIAATFFITAGMFGSMAVYGFVTKRDLSGIGSFLFMGLIGIIIATVVNMFLQSSGLSWAISMIGVIVFTGLTAYDIQKIKRMGEQGILSAGAETIQKGAIMGALALYLDFINLFIIMLRLTGGSKD